ncbi:MAG TPA: thioredoxin domain-containing protein [Elusimicrobiales bacterium]|nr:thioredoxin domain-containing protein [Elusimicrobiales bacterium]
MALKFNSSKLMAAGFVLALATAAALKLRVTDYAPVRKVADFRALGPTGAPVVIYEFSDFACPSCKFASQYIERLVSLNGAKLRVNFKHFPLTSMHPWSLTAAAYADCAGRQGKFWEYGKLLFEGQEAWAQAPQKPAQFEEYARKLQLDFAALESCADDPETLKTVQLDMAEGDLKGINGTPTFIVNRRRAVGGRQLLDAARLNNLVTDEPGGK